MPFQIWCKWENRKLSSPMESGRNTLKRADWLKTEQTPCYRGRVLVTTWNSTTGVRAPTWGIWSMLNSLGSFRLSILKLCCGGRWVAATPCYQSSLKALTWPGEALASGCWGCFPGRGQSEEVQSVSAKLQLDRDADCLWNVYLLVTAK